MESSDLSLFQRLPAARTSSARLGVGNKDSANRIIDGMYSSALIVCSIRLNVFTTRPSTNFVVSRHESQSSGFLAGKPVSMPEAT